MDINDNGAIVTGGASGCWMLPRLVGLRQAQELCLTNRRVNAEEAERIGLATRIFADDDLQQEALYLATQLASGATQALGATRKLLRESFSNGSETQLELEAAAFLRVVAQLMARKGSRPSSLAAARL